MCNAHYKFYIFQSPANSEWQLATCYHGDEFIAAVKKGNVHAVQFHPEKSGGNCPNPIL